MAKEKHSAKGKKKVAKEIEKRQDTKKPAKEIEELQNTLQRLQAEFENSRKRLEREKQEFAKLANAGMVKELLPLLDSMDAAENGIREQEAISKEKAIEGIELIKKQLLAIFGSLGLQEMSCIGQRFNPMLHDCVMQGKEKEKEDNCVLQEMQKGYMLNGKVLRHAKVKVNKL